MAPTIVVSGVGCMSDYAESSDAFFDNLKQNAWTLNRYLPIQPYRKYSVLGLTRNTRR